MFLQSQFQAGSQCDTKPEGYELFEGGWIDKATEWLGFGRWAIGRPNLAKSSGKASFHPTPLKHSAQYAEVGSVTQSRPSWSPIDGVELFLRHIPLPNELRTGAPWQNSIEYRNILVIGDQG